MEALKTFVENFVNEAEESVYVVKDELDDIIEVCTSEDAAKEVVAKWEKEDSHNKMTISKEKRSDYVKPE